VKPPETVEDLAEILRRQALHDRTILLEGNGSKRQMGGPVEDCDEYISISGLNRVIDYEPNDLTVSVEAGVLWRDLTSLLAQNRQMVPLDPPFAQTATVGGVIASNCCGPRRRLYGSARDLVIGMRFVTLGGKVVSSGGMVVKNVAGLDMGKLMIGSFGTLAAIAIVNFKVVPMPEAERTIVANFPTVRDAVSARDRVLASGLQPSALDLLGPGKLKHAPPRLEHDLPGQLEADSGQLGQGPEGWTVAIRAGGTEGAVARFHGDLGFRESEILDGSAHEAYWRGVEEFAPAFLDSNPRGAIVRASCTLKELESVMASFEVPAIARAGSGVCYGYFEQAEAAKAWLAQAGQRGWRAVIEYASAEDKPHLEMWPSPGGDFEIMQRVKKLFDPGNLLNRGRLYRLI
jgi:glycolate oxidase FAD binding subunit